MNKAYYYLNIIILAFIAPVAFAAENVKDASSKAIENFAKDHKIQAVYAIADNWEVKVQGAQGFADLDKNERLTVTEQMPIASGTKPMTAAAILLLQDRKLLNVKDTIAKHLNAESGMWEDNKIPGWAHKVTIHQLLTHSSGLPEYVFTFKINHAQTQEKVNKAILKFVADKELEFGPGTKFVYNNTGYMILGMIIEKVSGKKFADFMKKDIFEANGMNDTRIAGFDEAINSQLGKKHAFPIRYYVVPNGTQNPKFMPVGPEIVVAPNADGGAISTVSDLIKWNKALHGGKILSKNSYKKMIHKYFKATQSGGYETHIGYGMYISKMHDGTVIFHHEGRALGIRSDNGYLPKKNISYAIISNAMMHIPKEMLSKIDLKSPENQVDILYFRNMLLESL